MIWVAIGVAGVVAVLLLVCVVLALTLRRTGSVVEALAARLSELEEYTARISDELRSVDDGLGDVAAALREHRADVAAAGDRTAASGGPASVLEDGAGP